MCYDCSTSVVGASSETIKSFNIARLISPRHSDDMPRNSDNPAITSQPRSFDTNSPPSLDLMGYDIASWENFDVSQVAKVTKAPLREVTLAALQHLGLLLDLELPVLELTRFLNAVEALYSR
jgi:hypothetical protein